MHTGHRIHLFAAALLLATCLAGTVAGISLGIDWKQVPPTDSPFTGIVISSDGNTVFGGGNQLLVRSWDGSSHWGGQAGSVAAMSTDGNHVVSALGEAVVMYDNTGASSWTRNMGAPCRAVAIAPNGSFVISADDNGNLNSWAPNGDFWGRNTTDPAKRIAISPAGDLVVVTTLGGLRIYTSALDPVWTDNRSGSLDDYILISSDGSTIITAGDTRVSSHTNTGTLNWQVNVAKAAITDIAASDDCSIILVASQDGTVRALDRYGNVHWTFSTVQWANAVSASRDGSVIAVGANDGTLFVLDHGGNLLTKRKSDTAIQPRSIAVSRDGVRIVAADQQDLYGFELIGLTAGDKGSDTIYVEASLNPVRSTATTSPPQMPVTSQPAVTMPAETRSTTLPAPAATPKSPAALWTILPGGAAALWLAKRR
jgi:WD40 repeat protein